MYYRHPEVIGKYLHYLRYLHRREVKLKNEERVVRFYKKVEVLSPPLPKYLHR
jgi:hypothetical protein